jgi:hypothetical protein
MKYRPYTNNKNEDSAILVTAYLEELDLLQILVERLVDRNCDRGYALKLVPVNYRAIGPSSLEALVSGYIIISQENDLTEIPFMSCFLITCTKTEKSQYNLTWMSSLS